jgi:hypothetical protein
MHGKLAIGLALLAMSYLSVPAMADHPTLHTDVFTIGAPAHCGGVNWCTTVARGTMAQSGFMHDPRVAPFPQNVSLIAGGNDEAVVEVFCVPLSSTQVQVGVFAASNNRDRADFWRNTISQRMKGAGCL